MARKTNHRTEVSPVLTRFSPVELAAMDAKATLAGMNRSQAIRAAMEAWEPGSPPQEATKIGPGDIRIEYDEVEPK